MLALEKTILFLHSLMEKLNSKEKEITDLMLSVKPCKLNKIFNLVNNIIKLLKFFSVTGKHYREFLILLQQAI